jgi:histidine ammonia-lyase
MKNIFQIGTGQLTFETLERIINENLKLELATEAKERIEKARLFLDKKLKRPMNPYMASPPALVRYATKTYRLTN